MDQLVNPAHLRFSGVLTVISSMAMRQNVPHARPVIIPALTQIVLSALQLSQTVPLAQEGEPQPVSLVMKLSTLPQALHVWLVLMLTPTVMPATMLSNVLLATTDIMLTRPILAQLSQHAPFSIVKPV